MRVFLYVLLSAFAVYGVWALLFDLAERCFCPEMKNALTVVEVGPQTDMDVLRWFVRQRGRGLLLCTGRSAAAEKQLCSGCKACAFSRCGRCCCGVVVLEMRRGKGYHNKQ